jgi:hypothetical protein
MNCHIHTDRDAVAMCKSCGKGLCSECANVYTKPSCDACVKQYYAGVVAEKRKPIINTAVVAILGFLVGLSIANKPSETLFAGLLIMVMCLSIYWGWTFVKPMLFATIFGSILWKGQGFLIGMMLVCLAMCLGMIIGPIMFGKNVYDYFKNKRAYEVVRASY